MATVIGLAGSLREKSYNRALVRAVAELAPDGLEIDIGDIRGIPLYDADVEAEDGVPEAVARLKDRIAAADGLLLATPEYNHSIPGVFKNAIDWLTRPPKDIARVFADKPVALVGATPGGGGTRYAQSAWLPVLRTLRTRPWFGASVHIARAGDAFEEVDGLVTLTEADQRERLGRFLEGFAAFVGG